MNDRTSDVAAIRESILPFPREISILDGSVHVDPEKCRVRIEPPDQRLRDYAATIVSPAGNADVDTSGTLHVVINRRDVPKVQGYRLRAAGRSIEIVGHDPAGCFHGLVTLRQIVRHFGTIPSCLIEDHPELLSRGVLFDISRGRVPRIDTLKMIVDRLSEMKINHLQLYIEHAFVFSFDPEICDDSYGITPEEARELTRYAATRFIDVVPAVANLGHMGKILSMPAYRHLAEIEASATWSELPWPQRARGFTLDCLNPESHALVSSILDEVMDAFEGGTINICGDEPWDLGMGKNRDKLDDESRLDAYLSHVERVMTNCRLRGRSVQAWGDVVTSSRELMKRLPADLTVLHWGYDDNADYELVDKLVAEGVRVVACPGTSGWKRLLNAWPGAQKNIRQFAGVAREAGCSGLLTTDWGDHGHFNVLAGSWYPILAGAMHAWSSDQPDGADMDRAFSVWTGAAISPETTGSLRKLAGWGDDTETWHVLWSLPDRFCSADKWKAPREAEEYLDAALAAQKGLARCPRAGDEAAKDEVPAEDREELLVAVDFNILLLEFLQSGRNMADWPERLDAAHMRFVQAWHRRHKPSGLQDISRALQLVRDAVRSSSRDAKSTEIRA